MNDPVAELRGIRRGPLTLTKGAREVALSQILVAKVVFLPPPGEGGAKRQKGVFTPEENSGVKTPF